MSSDSIESFESSEVDEESASGPSTPHARADPRQPPPDTRAASPPDASFSSSTEEDDEMQSLMPSGLKKSGGVRSAFDEAERRKEYLDPPEPGPSAITLLVPIAILVPIFLGIQYLPKWWRRPPDDPGSAREKGQSRFYESLGVDPSVNNGPELIRGDQPWLLTPEQANHHLNWWTANYRFGPDMTPIYDLRKAHPKKQNLLAPLPEGDGECLPLKQWDQQTISKSRCHSFEGKGLIDTIACDPAYEKSLRFSVANEMFDDCDAECVYDIESGARITYSWDLLDNCYTSDRSSWYCKITRNHSRIYMQQKIPKLCGVDGKPGFYSLAVSGEEPNKTDKDEARFRRRLWEQGRRRHKPEKGLPGQGAFENLIRRLRWLREPD